MGLTTGCTSNPYSILHIVDPPCIHHLGQRARRLYTAASWRQLCIFCLYKWIIRDSISSYDWSTADGECPNTHPICYISSHHIKTPTTAYMLRPRRKTSELTNVLVSLPCGKGMRITCTIETGFLRWCRLVWLSLLLRNIPQRLRNICLHVNEGGWLGFSTPRIFKHWHFHAWSSVAMELKDRLTMARASRSFGPIISTTTLQGIGDSEISLSPKDEKLKKFLHWNFTVHEWITWEWNRSQTVPFEESMSMSTSLCKCEEGEALHFMSPFSTFLSLQKHDSVTLWCCEAWLSWSHGVD